jgi:hypothetical protein
MLSTLGIMVLCGTSISMMTTVIPAFLTAVGIADSIHVLAVFYRKYQAGAGKKESICYAMGHSGLAIVMTSITTAAGLLSFSFAEITTISDMGIYAAAGVMLALIYTIILLPALISLIPVKRKPVKSEPEKNEPKSSFMDRVLLFFAGISTKHPRKIILISILLLLISLGLISRLKFSSNIIHYFPDDHPCKIALNKVEDLFEGTITIEVIVDTGRENGIYEPAFMRKLETMEKKIAGLKNTDIYVGKIFSITDILKETNQALHGNDSSYYVIPDDRDTIAQELMLFENSGSNDLEKIADSLFSKTRFTIKTKWADSVTYEVFVKTVESLFEKAFAGEAEIVVTGISSLLARTIPAALHSMADSYIIAFCIISAFMLLLVGNLKLGILSMYPNILPIIMVMGCISLCGIDLDINTLFIGSIAIGLVVDDTIHFMYNFRKYFDITGDPVRAVEETLLGTGRAMLITSIVLSANFFVLVTATLNHSIRFGFFTGLVVILALFADFILAPALMVTATRVTEPSLEKTGAVCTGEASV